MVNRPRKARSNKIGGVELGYEVRVSRVKDIGRRLARRTRLPHVGGSSRRCWDSRVSAQRLNTFLVCRPSRQGGLIISTVVGLGQRTHI
jgi:hypothetical protein